jgi:glyoxylase-like metal-dependent hydrolase (beta-lactamase superfamily II)
MPIRFYDPEPQPITGRVTMLPQAGSVSGGSNRPLNSYAIRVADSTILFDAPVSWVMDALRRVHAEAPIRAHVLSHRDLARSGDAFEAQRDAFGMPFLMHPADQAEGAPAKLSMPLEDPRSHPALKGIEVIEMPGHSPGSVMLHLPDERVLLAGDCAVGAGPDQDANAPRLQRPIMGDDDAATFRDAMERLFDRLPALDAVLPLHGAWCLRAELGDAGFEAAISNVWDGEPMDPHGR